MRKKQIVTIPNILSLIRILFIPVFILIYTNAHTKQTFYFAALIILVSGLTDLADGYIARKYNMITDLGKVLDPLADKLTQVTVAICLAMRIKGIGILLVAFVIKEVLMISGGAFLIRKGTKLEGAKWFGKMATVIFYLVMFLIVAIPGMKPYLLRTLIMISLIAMIFSFLMYIPEFTKYLKETKNKTQR